MRLPRSSFPQSMYYPRRHRNRNNQKYHAMMSNGYRHEDSIRICHSWTFHISNHPVRLSIGHEMLNNNNPNFNLRVYHKVDHCQTRECLYDKACGMQLLCTRVLGKITLSHSRRRKHVHCACSGRRRGSVRPVATCVSGWRGAHLRIYTSVR